MEDRPRHEHRRRGVCAGSRLGVRDRRARFVEGWVKGQRRGLRPDCRDTGRGTLAAGHRLRAGPGV